MTIPITKNGEQVVVPLNQDALRALSIFRSRGDGTGQIVRNASGKPLHYNADWFVTGRARVGHQKFPLARLPTSLLPYVATKRNAT